MFIECLDDGTMVVVVTAVLLLSILKQQFLN